ncbi:FadR/GntR family transcriptional regulator [Noviherbaspirillum malthae]|uniref:FadR/GntR family transcriptional regulator n=1 Tax=Noviherbaspirillum malthae TaxID=1260987 RepID=UPI001890972B|nr:FadR/GntR family transcriptional regulator [Noviherbaspirillum malthae]
MRNVELKMISALSLADQVEHYVLGQLRSKELKPGDVLPPESELAIRLGVSRAPVREAMARLRAAGVLDTKPGRGSVILSSAPNTVHFAPTTHSLKFDENLFELRLTMESAGTALAAARRTEENLAAIQTAMNKMEIAAGSGLVDSEADVAFHRAVAQATHNPYMMSILEFISERFAAFVQTAWDNSKVIGAGPQPAIQEHQAILAAIRSGDQDRARLAALSHLYALKDRMLAGKSAIQEASLTVRVKK